MARLRHTADDVCPLCEDKLLCAHPRIADWFRRLKKRHPNVHVSSSWRGQSEQNQLFKEGKTRAPFPKSKHNHMEDGRPCSLALDLFQIDEDGVARFAPLFYAKVNAENEADRELIRWGGKFKSFVDGPHFELNS